MSVHPVVRRLERLSWEELRRRGLLLEDLLDTHGWGDDRGRQWVNEWLALMDEWGRRGGRVERVGRR